MFIENVMPLTIPWGSGIGDKFENEPHGCVLLVFVGGLRGACLKRCPSRLGPLRKRNMSECMGQY